MNSAPFVNPWPITYAATPATPWTVRNPIPHTNTPMWLIVENASSRFRCRCA